MIINIRVSVKKLLKEKYGIDPKVSEELLNMGLLDEYFCKRVLIKEEYEKKVQPEETERLRYKLAEKYSISERTVRRILYEDFK